MTERPTNRLARETSPYLRHHADNPVDWYPWGEEALARARDEDRPIFLSIGYAACHWCHVMERETFRDERIAAIMNERFVNIKVDREERPDLDDIYMTATQMLTKGGGWPNSVFLTPKLKPFFAGTYFPPEPRYGRPGFAQILISVADAYRDRREEVVRVSNELAEGIRRMSEFTASKQKLSPALLNRAFGDLGGRFDASEGGFSGPPKFPHGTEFSFLLRYHVRTGNPEALRMVVFTLDRMARGGIYDQLGGGFHRYAVDGQWIVPHFEKMLYDNALLSRVYLETAQVVSDLPPSHAVPEGGDATGARFRDVARETLDWVLREMTSAEGGFYSSLDADSEGEEGKFYVWTPQEIETHLGRQEGSLFCSVHGVTPKGDLPEGGSVLRLPKPLEGVAREFRTDLADLRLRMASARARLMQARERRGRPACDDKVLADWNALMISALAIAARTLDAPQYGDAARAAARFILDRMRPEKRLMHSYRDGAARHGGYLTDYAFLVAALIDLYETTFEPSWVREASDLAGEMLDLFWEDGTGGFLLTARDHEQLIARTRENHDGAVPAGASVAAMALPRLAALTGDADLSAKAEMVLRIYRDPIERFPAAFSAMLCALEQHLATQRQVVLAGDSGDPRLRSLERVLRSSYRPNTLVALADPKIAGTAALPLLLDKKPAGDAPAAYVCEDGTCKPPATSAEDLARLLT